MIQIAIQSQMAIPISIGIIAHPHIPATSPAAASSAQLRSECVRGCGIVLREKSRSGEKQWKTGK